jgi:hypothetical protein
MVPKHLRIGTDELEKLGKWLLSQAKKYKDGKLSQAQIAKLTRLGFFASTNKDLDQILNPIKYRRFDPNQRWHDWHINPYAGSRCNCCKNVIGSYDKVKWTNGYVVHAGCKQASKHTLEKLSHEGYQQPWHIDD